VVAWSEQHLEVEVPEFGFATPGCHAGEMDSSAAQVDEEQDEHIDQAG
jgi:hypothetical protein